MSLQYKRYEPNGRFQTERNDCVVRAISKAMNLNYSVAHTIVRDATGRKNRRGANLRHVMEYLHIEGIDGDKLKSQVDNGYTNSVRYPTLAQVADLMQRGKFVVRISGHAFAVIDGVQYDTSKNGARTRVLNIYEVI